MPIWHPFWSVPNNRPAAQYYSSFSKISPGPLVPDGPPGNNMLTNNVQLLWSSRRSLDELIEFVTLPYLLSSGPNTQGYPKSKREISKYKVENTLLVSLPPLYFIIKGVLNITKCTSPHNQLGTSRRNKVSHSWGPFLLTWINFNCNKN